MGHYNIRLAVKNASDGLAYFAQPSMTKKRKRFITLTLGNGQPTLGDAPREAKNG